MEYKINGCELIRQPDAQTGHAYQMHNVGEADVSGEVNGWWGWRALLSQHRASIANGATRDRIPIPN